MSDLKKLLQTLDKQLKTLCKCGKPRHPGFSICLQCYEEKQAERAAKELSSNGYVYEYDENGKVRLAARRIMSEIIGRPLREGEIVMYADGNKKNLAPENLVLGFKAGLPLDFLCCGQCGARGIDVIEPPNWRERLK